MRLGTTKSRAPSGVDFINTGVSTSIKPFSARNFLTSIATLLRKISLFFTGFRRMSRYLYFMRRSSPPSVSSSIVNGGSCAEFKTFNSETRISTSPVGMFGFFETLSITSPETWITNSRPNWEALSIISFAVRSSSKIS